MEHILRMGNTRNEQRRTLQMECRITNRGKAEVLVRGQTEHIAHHAAVNRAHRGRTLGNHHGIGTQTLAGQVAQTPAWQHPVVYIQPVIRCKQYIIAATQTPVLKGIIEHNALQIRIQRLQSTYTLHPVGTDSHRHFGEMRTHLHRFIAYSEGGVVGICQTKAFGGAPIPTR